MSSSDSSGDLGRPKVKKSETLWLMSFSDMLMTLLCFFVLMISTMKPVKQKFENMQDGLNPKGIPAMRRNLTDIHKQLSQLIHEKNLAQAAEVSYDASGLHLEFKDGVLFLPGHNDLRQENRQVVASVLEIIAKIGPTYNVVIEGHSDDTPLHAGGAFPSNWELAAARGFTLMRALHDLHIDEERVSVVSYAHTRPKIAYKTLTGSALKTARAANRRVVVWIE